MESQLRLAIVEDNATARTNLRSHLLPLGIFDIHSFSNGNELRAALKRMSMDIVLIDYHLGQHRNGVDCVHSLMVSGHIKPSTGIFFITADRQAKTIGQIMDLHPDVLIVKPYTMAALLRHMQRYLEVRSLTSDVLKATDSQLFSVALRKTKNLIIAAQDKATNTNKYLPELNKLLAKLLMQNGFYSAALTLFNKILQRSEKILWANWGKIKCQFMLGEWHACEETLHHLVNTNFTRDKAFEWLASLCIERQSYQEASDFLDNINTSELSVAATRLKSLAFRKQNKVIEGISLLQKQREHNRSVRELFDEFTYELAEFYIAIAEETPQNQRKESLSQARKLVGMATRGESDPQLKTQRDILLAYSSALEGDSNKARKILEGISMAALNNANPTALFTASKIFHTLDDTDTARNVLAQAELRLARSDDQAWLSVMNTNLVDSEKTVGIDKEKAVRLNEEGMVLFSNRQMEKAMPLFYSAYQRIPSMPAFALNLLQCMTELNRDSYRLITADFLIEELSSTPLNDINQLRLEKLRFDLTKAKAETNSINNY
jgi:CheY-like chemotaxis protein